MSKLPYLFKFALGFVFATFFHEPLKQSLHSHDISGVTHEMFDQTCFPLPRVGQLIHRDGFTILYDGERKNPRCVIEALTREELQGSSDRASHEFREDENIPQHLRASLADYKGSGLDRGHMAPAANHKKSVQRMAESFFLSNVCPQSPELNRNYWAKVKRHVRDLTKQYDTVQVITGPLYMPQGEPGARFLYHRCIGENDVAVPTHFFKVLRLELGSDVEELAYIMPNEHIAPKRHLKRFG